MKVIVVGYGRMGAGLAAQLHNEGHEVIIIDANKKLASLKKQLSMQIVIGMGFDKTVLEKAKIKKVDALVACTNSDETNAVVARIAKSMYQVPNVIARLYDPSKAEIYNALGIRSISTTSWGILRARDIINYNHLDSILSLGNGSIEIVKIEVPVHLENRVIEELMIPGEVQPVGIYRNNKAYIPTTGFVLHKEDILYVSVTVSAMLQLQNIVGLR